MAQYVIGVDIGTGSSKAVLTTPAGTVVATAEREHRTANPRPGWFEHDAEGLWWADFAALVREILPENPREVAALATSGIGPVVLPVDAENTPLRPAILYGVDTRASDICGPLEEELRGRFGLDEAGLLAKLGARLGSQAAGPKLLWLAEHEPEVWARTRRFMMANTYLVHRLTGEYVLDHHSASQVQPFYDLAAGGWDDALARDYLPNLELPRLVWPADIAGRVTPEAAALTGLPEGLPVAGGTIDAWAEAESVDAGRPGDLMLMYGSTMFFIGFTPERVVAPALWSTEGTRPGRPTLSGGMASSGSVTGWLRELTGAQDFARLVADAAEVPRGANGLLVLPYFAGERTPFADPQARGVIAGLTLAHTEADLYRAVLEATANAVRHNLEAFEAAGFTPTRVIGVGGGTKHPLWPGIVSDTTGATQILPETRIGASYGDAKFAAVAAGLAEVGAEWNTDHRVVEPDEDATRFYARRYPLYTRLRDSTLSVSHELAEEQRRLTTGGPSHA